MGVLPVHVACGVHGASRACSVRVVYGVHVRMFPLCVCAVCDVWCVWCVRCMWCVRCVGCGVGVVCDVCGTWCVCNVRAMCP